MPHTLLAADDSATIRRVIELTFAHLDITVVTVGDGDTAIASLDTAPPDIVLADIQMPGRSGYEIAGHIQSTPALAHIPVLLLAGAFEAVDHAKVALLGCAGVLTKPLDPQLVIRNVTELLGASSRARVERAADTPLTDAPDRASVPAVAPSEKPAPIAPAPMVPPPVVAEPSIAAFVMASPPAPVIHSLGPAPTPLASVPPVRSDREVEAYLEELDQKLASLSREDRPSLHEVEPPQVEPEDEVLAAPLPSAAVTPSEGSHFVAPGGGRPALSPPSLVAAFSALLTAERATPDRPVAPTRPVFDGATAPASDEVLERIARLALDRLSEDDIRGVVERVVSETAERLIREEIARITSNIK